MSSTHYVYVGPYLEIPQQEGFDIWEYTSQIKETLSQAHMEESTTYYLTANIDAKGPNRMTTFDRHEGEHAISLIGVCVEEMRAFTDACEEEITLLESQGVKHRVGWGVLSYYY